MSAFISKKSFRNSTNKLDKNLNNSQNNGMLYIPQNDIIENLYENILDITPTRIEGVLYAYIKGSKYKHFIERIYYYSKSFMKGEPIMIRMFKRS